MATRIRPGEYEALAEIRYRIRRFLVFSEASAREVGVEPQQHQLLLAIRGMPADQSLTIGRIAERLQIQHNSTVELVNRSCEKGLVEKHTSAGDRREVRLEITARGKRLLEELAVSHRTELRNAAPALVDALMALVADDTPAERSAEQPAEKPAKRRKAKTQ
jgi:DNA-binding MarR family transcriptional regulator